jgi:Tol biopolymer transport system component
VSLTSGLRLGPYQVLGALGSGGMGEVYRARDTRLERDVALKTLPADVAADPERRQRFEREARAVAALNHPAVLSLYDVGDAGGLVFIVTELLEGETLRERLLRGRLPCERAAEWCAAAADALAAAHERGIVHRDVKPENLFLTRDGRLKVLDFGLAKELPVLVGSAATDAPTLASPTRTGIVLGTLGYLSPEQARGEPVDARSDLFSLGCVLYECLTGRRAFAGSTAQDLIAAVLRDEPPSLVGVRSDLPPGLARLVERSLAKERTQRFQSASDLAFALRAATSGSGASVATKAPRRRFPRAVWLAGAGVGLLGLAAGYGLRRSPEPLEPLVLALTGGSSREASPAISPDGKFVAYFASEADRTDVWVKFLGGAPGVNLTRASGLEVQSQATIGGLDISPDGSAIAVYAGRPGTPSAERGTWLIPAPLGGPPRMLVKRAGGLRWSLDGQRIAYMRPDPASGDAILVARADGADERVLVPAALGIHAHEPAWSADGTAVYFARGPMNNNQPPTEIWRVPSGGGEAERVVVTEGIAESPLPTPDGRGLVYAGDQAGGALNLWWRPLRGGRERRLTRGAGEYLAPRASRDGRRLVCEARTSKGSLRTLDLGPAAAERSLTDGGGEDASPSIARTGMLAFVSGRNGTPDIWVSEADGSQARPLTSDADSDSLPAISPDGSHVAFVSTRAGRRGLWLAQTGGGPPARLLEADVLDRPSWSADGRRLVYSAEGANRQAVLWIIPAGGGAPVQIPGVSGRCPAWSPVGDDIAYFTSSPSSGQQAVRVTNSRGESRAQILQLPIGAVDAQAFSWDGRRLAIARSPGTAKGEIVLADIERGTGRLLLQLGPFEGVRGIAWTPDDSRLVYGRVQHESRILLFEGLDLGNGRTNGPTD